MIWYLYILLCDQKTFYIGITTNIGKRVEEHKSKCSFFTKKFSDIRLIYTEQFKTKEEARKREKQLKGWSHAKKKALISNKRSLLVKLSKST